MALKSFNEAVAVITGEASGIGLATAKALRSRDAHVVLVDINAVGLQQAEKQVCLQALEATEQVLSMVTDVTSESQIAVLPTMRQQQSIQEYRKGQWSARSRFIWS